ncbi:MAG TPA: TfoX/Sxy family protein [Acidimicrobiales bacterium]|nr:TfoX/Sxy family protein [Acidimicrobiales bacterium]
MAREYRIVAYDEDLANRIRDLVAGEPGLTEQKMFGGLGFLVGGNMAVAASGQGGLMVRVSPVQSADLVANTPAYVAEMGGREMLGWLRVDIEHLRDADELAEWVERGTKFARSLPPKKPKR